MTTHLKSMGSGGQVIFLDADAQAPVREIPTEGGVVRRVAPGFKCWRAIQAIDKGPPVFLTSGSGPFFERFKDKVRYPFTHLRLPRRLPSLSPYFLFADNSLHLSFPLSLCLVLSRSHSLSHTHAHARTYAHAHTHTRARACAREHVRVHARECGGEYTKWRLWVFWQVGMRGKLGGLGKGSTANGGWGDA
jgi:hypothetical protein